MKNEESVFTHFNFSFTTFPRQVFVKFFDMKKHLIHQHSNPSFMRLGIVKRHDLWKKELKIIPQGTPVSLSVEAGALLPLEPSLAPSSTSV